MQDLTLIRIEQKFLIVAKRVLISDGMTISRSSVVTYGLAYLDTGLKSYVMMMAYRRTKICT